MLNLTTYHMHQETKQFMEGVEARMGNACQPIHDNITPENIYCSAFGEVNGMDAPLSHIGWNNRCLDT